MATVNIGHERVMVIEIHNGEVSSVTDEGRSVYENSKGRFIKTKKSRYAQVFLDENNRAVLAYRNWRPIIMTIGEIQSALHAMFVDYDLKDFIK